ncbi:MAG: transposase [Paracoccus sp. (in: a-proteobacteria)]
MSLQGLHASMCDIVRQTCDDMDVHIVRGVLARDQVHMFLSIPPKLSLSDVRRGSRASRSTQGVS